MTSSIKIPIVWVGFLVITILIAILQDALSLPIELGFAQAGPALGTLLFAGLVWKERITLRSFLVARDHPFYMGVFVVLLPLILAIVAKTIGDFFDDTSLVVDQISGNRLWLILIWAPFGAILEEVGWRSYMQRLFDRAMQKRHLLADVLLGTLWTAWHIGNYQYGILFLLGQWILLVSISVILGDLMRRYGYNLIQASLMHLSINLGVIYLMYVGSSTELTMVVYGAVTLLFTMYYLASVKKIQNI